MRKCGCPSRCQICGARLRRDAVGHLCPTRNCQNRHAYPGCKLAQTPHWERGYRSHGYWLGSERVGWVTRPPGKMTGQDYGWRYDWSDGARSEGRSPSLRQAKRMVEQIYQKDRT